MKKYFKFLLVNLSETTIEILIKFAALATFILIIGVGSIFLKGKNLEEMSDILQLLSVVFLEIVAFCLVVVVICVIFDVVKTTIKYFKNMR